MGTEQRLKPLHNFTMSGGLRWGNTRHLRCMKINNNNHHHHPCPPELFLNGSKSPPDDDGIAAVRERVISDLQTAADKMKHTIFKESPPPQRPWNLRTRRAACKTTPNSGDYLKLDYLPKPGSGFGYYTTQTTETVAVGLEKSPLVGTTGDDGGGEAGSGGKRERAKFSVALSKKEIEEDFVVFGHRLHRRPKKRPKVVQKQLDTLFPGLWLTEVTPDMYKVPEAAP